MRWTCILLLQSYDYLAKQLSLITVEWFVTVQMMRTLDEMIRSFIKAALIHDEVVSFFTEDIVSKNYPTHHLGGTSIPP